MKQIFFYEIVVRFDSGERDTLMVAARSSKAAINEAYRRLMVSERDDRVINLSLEFVTEDVI